MDFEKLYEELCLQQIQKYGDSVKIRSGLFQENDNIPVFVTGGIDLYFSIDKAGMKELLQNIIGRLNEIKAIDDFNKMIDLFNIIQSEMTNYFGKGGQISREQYYMLNGKNIDEDTRLCSMSDIKGKGIAKCAEKSSVANNLLLFLNKMNIFPYDINYMNSLIEMQNEKGGHAFLGFSRTNSVGNKMYLLYDVTNPEIILTNGGELNYPAVYSLDEDDFNSFVQNGSFDNSHFILSQTYPVKDKRVYSGFHVDALKQARE